MNNQAFVSVIQPYKTLLLTSIALVAFAANSVLCRMALSGGLNSAIDANSFTFIRLLTGAITLGILHWIFYRPQPTLATQLAEPHNQSSSVKPSFVSRVYQYLSALMLLMYAWFFSVGYLFLDTGTGALILFGAVQVTMIMCAILQGHKPTLIEMSGIFLAFMGLAYLIWPSLTEPTFSGFILMSLSGVAWGMYSVLGKHRAAQPLNSSSVLTTNFIHFGRAVVGMLVVMVILYLYPLIYQQAEFIELRISQQGIWLAAMSGIFASGLGYAIWYAALTGLQATQAASVQLSVPLLAAVGGLIFMQEQITLHLLMSGSIILAGIAIVILFKPK
ncbi:DMT family transporter [Shewanella gaetbuli]|uniref:DMT family transporter n=1 Tax=Shewanella gaetbuli TaxID=220752 RepID=A0A9X1ZPU7_9GAMM|nr:DMT family transporter [Shewanella gaetbuli]